MSSRTEMITVEVSQPGTRLDVFLCGKFPAVSRGADPAADRGGAHPGGRQNGEADASSARGGANSVHWPEARPAEAQPEDMPLDILFEDKDLLVLNKPPGLVVHPAAGHEEHTLVNALLHHCAGGLSGIGGVARPGIVHRPGQGHERLPGGGEKRRRAPRAGGTVRRPDDGQDLPGDCVRRGFARNRGNPRGDCAASLAPQTDGGDGRRRARGVDELPRAWNGCARRRCVEALLHTGRTHQIRVHFQHLGFPVAGDATYGAAKTSGSRN